jgi:hypothetical protein
VEGCGSGWGRGHGEGCTDAHRFDILADGAALVSHVLPDIVGCTHLGCPRHRGRVLVLHQDWAQALGAL